jgi:hypothetical protein
MSQGEYQLRIDDLTDLLRNRFAVYPVRDNSYIQLSMALDSFSNYLIETTDFDNFSPNADIIKEVEVFSDKPIFVCGAMKSGTTLITQLLDSHPDLVVMPGDSHFANHLKKWGREQFSQIAAYWLHRVINPTGKEPFWFFGKDENSFRLFLQYLRYFLLNSQYDIFVCVVMSIFAVNSSLTGFTSKKYWVEKTPHNEFKAQELSNRFQCAKFIHVIRNPLNNIASLKKYSEIRGWRTTSIQNAYNMRKLFRSARVNREILGKDKYHIVKYEDIVSNTQKVVNEICNFLNIPFHEILLIPTENGRPGMSNSVFESGRVKGVVLNQSDTKRYMKHLSKQEIQDIVTVLYNDVIELGYNWNKPDIKCYRRTKFEQLTHGFIEFGKLIRFKVMRHSKGM